MKRICLSAVVVGLALMGAAACSSTTFKSTWKDPSVGHLDLRGKHVVALIVTPNESLRRAGETALAREMAEHGVQPVLGYQIISQSDLKDSETMRGKLARAGVDGAVVMRVIDRRQEVSYVPGMGPYGTSLYGYYDYAWAAVSDPGYLTTNTIVSVETLVYSVPQDKLLWAGVSETFDPSSLDSSIADIAKKAAKEMKKAGLIV